MRRLEEVLRQMCQAAKNIGNTDLENKFSEGIKLIKRDIVFAASLYLWCFDIFVHSLVMVLRSSVNFSGNAAGRDVTISAWKLVSWRDTDQKWKFNVIFSKKVGIVLDNYGENI
jgi:hypothetical protein